jgi:hypothetical protein
MNGELVELEYKQAVDFLLPKHYSGRIPNIKYAFGWIVEKEIVAVCTFGKPASNSLCEGICGKEFSKNVYELNRLCRIDDFKSPISSFVGACLRKLKCEHLIIVSYSDTDMNHHGYIYQACNFIYTGITKQRTDKYTEGNKHSRHYDNSEQKGIRKIRSAKHRYVFFCSNDKREKKSWQESLNYPVLPYPKGDNSTYILGEYQQVKLVISE